MTRVHRGGKGISPKQAIVGGRLNKSVTVQISCPVNLKVQSFYWAAI